MAEEAKPIIPEVVEEDNESEKKGSIWCKDNGHWKNAEVCAECNKHAGCEEYAAFLGIDRRTRAIALDTDIEILKISIFDTYYQLGESLREMRDGIYYRELGYDSLDEYAEAKHEFRYRKAAYLISIVENCEAAGVTKEDVRGIEWSKMKELPDLTEDNRAEWLKKASKLSVEDLKAEVKKSKGQEPKEKKLHMAFAFDEAQKELVDRALNLAAKLTGSSVRSFHLQVMAEEFIATYESEDEASMARFNDIYGGGEDKDVEEN
ncbi:hypothetical protein KAR91_74980 [Candidatus Pacearchaeota archaeon]|nr:hypothetical protein [Candidatus Pacearchaeota archaeon]